MKFSEELTKLVLERLKATVKSPSNKSNLDELVDKTTKAMGFSKITKRGYTP